MTIPEPRFRSHPRVVYTRVNDGEGVLLSLVTTRYYSLNESGLRLWEALATDASLGRLVEVLAEEYEITGEGAEEIVAEFLEQLEAEHLLQPRDPGRGETHGAAR